MKQESALGAMARGGLGSAPTVAAVFVAALTVLGTAVHGDEVREVELRDLGLLARLVDELEPAQVREERKSGVPGFEVRSDEKVFGRAKAGRPWLLELRVAGGAIELTAVNDSRTDFSIEAVQLECEGLSAVVAPMPQLLRSNALEATRIARLLPDATTTKVCAGRIASDNGVSSRLKIQFTPLSGGQASERRPQ